MNSRVGQQLGNYRLIRLLGEGGFAEVYLGEHVHLNRLAAIKVLHTRMTQNDLEAFKKEAQTVAGLKHKHIIQVLEFGVEQHTPYLVMEYAANGTLRQRHPDGVRLSLRECLIYLQPIAEALQYAHERKIIHRDVKPENMLIGEDGSILLGDFGIAMISQSSRYQGRQEVGGTAAYMAPEQLNGKATAASDQYALAIVLYEWLSGDKPFKGSFVEICSQHLLTSPPSLRQKVPGLSPTLEAVVFRAFAKDPQQRYLSVLAFLDALQAAHHGQPLPEMSPGIPGSDSTLLREPRAATHPAATPPMAPVIDEQYIPTVIKEPHTTLPPSLPAAPNTMYPPHPQQSTSSRQYTIPSSPTPPLYNTGYPLPSSPYIPQTHSQRKHLTPWMFVAIFAIVVLGSGLFANAYILSHINPPGPSPTATTGPGTPTPAPTATTASSTSTPVPTANTIKTINENLNIPCKDCGQSYDQLQLTLILNKITIDSTQSTTKLFLVVKNVSNQDHSSLHFSQLTLQNNQDGTNISGTITNSTDNTWSLAPGNDSLEVASFPLMPQAGVHYTLMVQIGDCCVGATFQNETFTF